MTVTFTMKIIVTFAPRSKIARILSRSARCLIFEWGLIGTTVEVTGSVIGVWRLVIFRLGVILLIKTLAFILILETRRFLLTAGVEIKRIVGVVIWPVIWLCALLIIPTSSLCPKNEFIKIYIFLIYNLNNREKVLYNWDNYFIPSTSRRLMTSTMSLMPIRFVISVKFRTNVFINGQRFHLSWQFIL